MLPQTSTHLGYPPATRRPRSWQSYLSRLVALVALLGAIGASQSAWGQALGLTDDVITLTTQPTGQSAQSGRNFTGSDNNGLYSNPTPLGQSSDNTIDVPQLGTYDLNGTSTITITGAQLQGVINSSSTNVTATRFQYRVYLTGTADAQKPAYTNETLTSSQTGNSSGSIYTGSTSSLSINVLSGLTNGGTYIIDIRFQADATKGTKQATFTDLSSGDYFFANFYVTPPAVTPAGGTTTWQSTNSTEWTLASNWSNGVPNLKSNAIIPDKSNAAIVYPVLDNPNQNYSVQNLTLNGSGSTAAQLTVKTAVLRVYGDLNQRGGGLAGATTNTIGSLDSTANSTLIFAGSNQLITGIVSFSDIIVAGSGTKSVINVVRPLNVIGLEPASVSKGVIIQSAAYDINNNIVTSYSFDTSGTSYVDLASNASISSVSSQNETTTSYIRGVVTANRAITKSGVKNTFGNIGLDITANHIPGNIYVYRVVGEPLQGPAATAVPIKRRYRIEGDDDSGSNASASSTLDLVFHYLPNSDELNGIKQKQLTMFRTVNNGIPYDYLGGTLDTVQHTVTRYGAPSLNKVTVTLGDKDNPLPVSLVAFGATRSGANTLLSWTTASEERNTGFNVQVSTDGINFRTLSFVSSKSPNSSTTLNYQYTDTEAGKTGTRYYRLEQVDEGGAKNYSPVRLVNFSGTTAGTGTLVAYPNPFNEGVSLTLDGGMVADGTAVVKLVDMTGRTVRESKLSLVGASLTLSDMGTLRSGLYLAKVTLPDGTTQTVRISKQ